MDQATSPSPITSAAAGVAPTASRRLRRRWRVVAPVVAVVAVALAAAACVPSAGTPAGDGLAAMNQDRAAAGLGPLSWDGDLNGIAQGRANDMAASGVMQHSDLAGLLRSGAVPGAYALGENLLMADAGTSGAAAEDLWMNSPPHRANILNGGFNRVGIAMAQDGAGRVWYAAVFGAR